MTRALNNKARRRFLRVMVSPAKDDVLVTFAANPPWPCTWRGNAMRTGTLDAEALERLAGRKPLASPAQAEVERRTLKGRADRDSRAGTEVSATEKVIARPQLA